LTRSLYPWKTHGANTPIQQHSIAKHEVLEAYLLAYLQTLVTSPQQDELRVTLVDGFAGGGVYKHADTGERVLGSPLVFLNTVKAAEALINQERQKPIRMAVDYFFIEKDPYAVDLLNKTLQEEGFGARIGNDVVIRKNLFEDEADSIREFIKKKSPRAGRSLFLLDQYGYTDVPFPLIRTILSQLPRSEIILTFAVDSLINYASDNSIATKDSLNRLGIPDVLRGRSIEDIKKNESDFRLYIQSCLYRDLVEACGAPYYTLFFIRTSGHGDYWLVHLSQHHKARDVMTQVHWAKNNQFIHYGGAGVDMFRVLGYSPRYDAAARGQSCFGFCFDNPAETASVAALAEQLPHFIYAHEDGIPFRELFATTCNTSPADSDKYKQALERLVETKDIQIVSPTGGQRRKAGTISDQDMLVPSRQIGLFGPSSH